MRFLTIILLLGLGMASWAKGAGEWLVKQEGKNILLHKETLEHFFTEQRVKKAVAQLHFKPAVSGLVVESLPEGSPYTQLGVQSGDLLESLNGVPLTLTSVFDSTKTHALVEDWQKKKPFVLLLERKGKAEHLNYLVR